MSVAIGPLLAGIRGIPIVLDPMMPLTVLRNGHQRTVHCCLFSSTGAPTLLVAGDSVDSRVFANVSRVHVHPD